MESSEDDAGTATSASRRASAREKDVGQAADVDATSSYHQDINEGRTSCRTPAMSEDNFDGDSVPSPSAQDVNTSTEAILDMIDEIVDGPGAPKRLPLSSLVNDNTKELVMSTDNSNCSQDFSELSDGSNRPQEQTIPEAEYGAKSEIIATATSSVQIEHSSPSETITKVDTAGNVKSPHDIVSVTDSKQIVVCAPPEPASAVLMVPETSVACQILPSSSVLQSDSVVSDSEKQERTLEFKSVTSSDNRDCITIEKAESTSNECIVSDTRLTGEEILLKSPLKRRLVRPPPSDRRPDSTVTSTADSQSVFSNIQSSDTVTKDVSSSSDAMPMMIDNNKVEEIRNISDVSICKAEASVSPPKKIKLIRQKNSTQTHTEYSNTSDDKAPSLAEQCESTSTEVPILPVPDLHEQSSCTVMSTSEQQESCQTSSGSLMPESLMEAPSVYDQKEQCASLPSQESEAHSQSIINIPIEDNNSQSIATYLEYVKCLELQESVASDFKRDKKCDKKDEPKHTIISKDDANTVSQAETTATATPKERKVSTSDSENRKQITQKTSNIIVDSELSISPSVITEPSIKNCDGVVVEPEGNKTIVDPVQDDYKNLAPIKLNVTNLPEASTSQFVKDEEQKSINKNESESVKQIPKLTIRLSNKQSEEIKSPIPKLTIKPIRPPTDDIESCKDTEQKFTPITKLNIKPIPKPITDINEKLSSPQIHEDDKIENKQQIPSVTKINIKPILRPPDEVNEMLPKLHSDVQRSNKDSTLENVPCVTKLNIKPILKPPEKINDIHRKSSSSEISESEYSENDESTSTSDQASTSDQGPSDIVPKVTIKLGKPGTESEGKFYTEQNIPKLTIKGLHNCGNEEDDSTSKLKLIINQSDDSQLDKIPKITIKTVAKSDGQPLSPKLTIKPLKAPDHLQESEILKNKSTDYSGNPEIKENTHVPKITIKTITRSETDTASRTPKKSTVSNDNAEHIPVITKLNIKPILKPTECENIDNENDIVPVVSKLNIKPIVKPKDNELECSIDDVPKITKLNIKPLRNPEENSSELKDCDADTDENSIPVVTKINIKPIVKPVEEDVSKDSENQSSETGNSSDDNADIPVVTKLNIKPVLKPIDSEETPKSSICSEQIIPSITKLNIKPLIKPDDNSTQSSPKKENLKSPEFRSSNIPVITKLNIKPVINPDGKDQFKSKDENEEKSLKNPPLVMKINMKAVVENTQATDENLLQSEHICNNLNEHSDILEPNVESKTSIKHTDTDKLHNIQLCSSDVQQSCVENRPNSLHDHAVFDKTESKISETPIIQNCVSDKLDDSNIKESISAAKKSNLNTPVVDSEESKSSAQTNPSLHDDSQLDRSLMNANISEPTLEMTKESQSLELSDTRAMHQPEVPALNITPFVQNCKLLKKLLENSRDQLSKKVEEPKNVNKCTLLPEKKDNKLCHKDVVNCSTSLGSPQEFRQSADNSLKTISIEASPDADKPSIITDKINDISHSTLSFEVTKPLEISISEKYSGQSSGQDSPRIILKINKTDHGSSAKIITEDMKKSDNFQQKYAEYTQENLSDRENPRKHLVISRRKINSEDSVSLTVGKRLRSSRIVENTDKSPAVKRNVGKRPSSTEVSPVQNKETELSVLETKRLKLGQLLSGNKSLSITPVVRATQLSPTKLGLDNKQVVKVPNHTILNNENCSKNGNSKLHNILSNLQAKQKQSLNINDATVTDKNQSVSPNVGSDVKSNVASTGNCHVQELIISDNCEMRDHGLGSEKVLKDPLEVSTPKPPCDMISDKIIAPRIEELTPQPKKRGRPRKLPVSEGAKPATITLPVPALEERPQRSLRLTRDRPTILTKPRGRGRGRGRRVEISTPTVPEAVSVEDIQERVLRTIDPTSSRIKLPRMTEALDLMPGGCSTPLTSRRRTSSGAFSEGELKVVLEAVPKLEEAFIKSPEVLGRGRGGRGSRGGRGRTPRGRGRGRGGGRGAVYMKETMGIYGRVCGPATTTVQLFEEETCMMDDNATPAKPSHLLDEDSQSSVKSSTNESSKMKKSKFSDLFDSSKVWTAADVKEYTWPTDASADALPQVMMIQEQVAMFLSVKSFKRRYPELKRRPIVGEEKDYVLAKGLASEALCDLGITAVDASEVLDIMLSDYPHKYEEYRSHQRERKLNEPPPDPLVEVKPEEKPIKVEMKPEKLVDQKPELPKIDPEKTRQDLAAAAIASASEWNARLNALRRPACADLQSLCVWRRRAPARAPPRAAPRTHLRPPAGFYPHALLPGQYQHWYRTYTPEQLRYFPLNTALAAPPAPPSPAESSSDSEQECGSRSSSSEDSDSRTQPAKRKKLSKVKRSSQTETKEKEKEKEDTEPAVEDTCRVCKLRLEGNRKYTHERFLVCASCQAKLHPACVELSADTIRKCREYAWQCAECKTCCACHLPADDDKMLFCDLCDRGFHIYCVGLSAVPNGRWHCVECAVCKSCGAREPAGLPPPAPDPSASLAPAPSPSPAAAAAAAPAPTWHHQTRRGPGGHKVYSHSLCTPCARAYRIGRYCPLCERSFIGPKGTMQLVICKLCDRQLHQECVRQTVSRLSALNVLDYTCAECRRGGITSRAAAVRLAPRTIATLFMAKRRFNKYAHRQYMRSRMLEAEAEAEAGADAETDACSNPPSPPDQGAG